MDKDERKIEELVEKLMSADNLEQAPINFTDQVMSKVNAISASKTIVYKPLIPKYMWWLFAAGFVSLFAYVIFKSPSESSSISERYNLPDLSLNPLEGLSVDFSNTLMYATFFFAVMVCIQIPLLKQYFNNRLSY